MAKDTKKKGKRPGPLFTKIPGAWVPKKQDESKLDKADCKEEDQDDAELIDLTKGEKPTELVEAKLDPDKQKRKTKTKAPSNPETDNEEEFDGEDTDNDYKVSNASDTESSEESLLVELDDDKKKPVRPNKKKSVDNKKKVKPKSSVVIVEEGIIPGTIPTKDSRHKYNYKATNTKGGPCTIFCSVCNDYFNQTPGHAKNFQYHILTVHATPCEGEKYSCQMCGSVLRDKRAMKQHFNVHRTMEKPKQCPTCGKTFTEVNSWKAHTHERRRRKVYAAKRVKYTCELCGKICATKTSLTTHILNIHEKKGRKCRWCPLLVPYDEWAEHKKMEKIKHNYNAAVSCNICGATYTSKDSLANHRRAFHQDRPEVKCDLCGKTFKCKQYLGVHKVHAHADKRFECAYCQYRNGFRHLVVLHIRNRHHMKREDIPNDAVIEHEEGPVPDQEPRVKSKKKKPSASDTNTQEASITEMTTHQMMDPRTAAMLSGFQF